MIDNLDGVDHEEINVLKSAKVVPLDQYDF